MERARSFPSRATPAQGRRGLAALPYALLPGAKATAETAAVDYPLAEWAPASASNYTASSRPQAYPLDYVVIHVTQETFPEPWPSSRTPRRRCPRCLVRSADGHVAECVRERDIAWHAGNWDYNTRSIGIEHEGWVDQARLFHRRALRGVRQAHGRDLREARHPQGPGSHHRPLRGTGHRPH